MTREEAKALLLNISAYDIDTQRGLPKQEAIEMAIKALEQEPKTDIGKIRAEIITRYSDSICAEESGCLNELLEIIDNGTPIEPKTGHWSHDGSHWKNRWICSECGYKLFGEQTKFCPNCGSKNE